MWQVPELAGFWLVSFILQLPLVCFLLFNEYTLVLPLERAVHIVMLLFILFEVVQGYVAIKRMTDAQVEKFHLQRFKEDLEMEDEHTNTLAFEDIASSTSKKKINWSLFVGVYLHFNLSYKHFLTEQRNSSFFSTIKKIIFLIVLNKFWIFPVFLLNT